MADKVHSLAAKEFLAQKLSAESTARAGEIIDKLIFKYQGQEGPLLTNISFLKHAREQLEGSLNVAKVMAGASVLVPLGAMGLVGGFSAPDLDISLLGIGYHRYFLFHSAIGLAVLRYFYRQWLQGQQCPAGPLGRAANKAAGAALAGLSMGVGLHLMIDVFQPKAVIFPFFGSLVDGTLVDDNIWLMGNSLWAFKIGHDIITLTFARELEAAKKFVYEKFGNNLSIKVFKKGE